MTDANTMELRRRGLRAARYRGHLLSETKRPGYDYYAVCTECKRTLMIGKAAIHGTPLPMLRGSALEADCDG